MSCRCASPKKTQQSANGWHRSADGNAAHPAQYWRQPSHPVWWQSVLKAIKSTCMVTISTEGNQVTLCMVTIPASFPSSAAASGQLTKMQPYKRSTHRNAAPQAVKSAKRSPISCQLTEMEPYKGYKCQHPPDNHVSNQSRPARSHAWHSHYMWRACSAVMTRCCWGMRDIWWNAFGMSPPLVKQDWRTRPSGVCARARMRVCVCSSCKRAPLRRAQIQGSICPLQLSKEMGRGAAQHIETYANSTLRLTPTAHWDLRQQHIETYANSTLRLTPTLSNSLANSNSMFCWCCSSC